VDERDCMMFHRSGGRGVTSGARVVLSLICASPADQRDGTVRVTDGVAKLEPGVWFRWSDPRLLHVSCNHCGVLDRDARARRRRRRPSCSAITQSACRRWRELHDTFRSGEIFDECMECMQHACAGSFQCTRSCMRPPCLADLAQSRTPRDAS
jgi:hypothetical protein